MNYLQVTIGTPLNLSINKSWNIKWYFDAAFAAHKDIRIRTGNFITMETGGIYFQYRKQNLNTKISTKSEIFGM